MRAGLQFRRRLEHRTDPQPGERLTVTLYGSLAHTGKGHLTDLAVVAGLSGLGPEDAAAMSMQSVVEEVSASAQSLAAMAQELQAMVARFKLSADETAGRPTWEPQAVAAAQAPPWNPRSKAATATDMKRCRA